MELNGRHFFCRPLLKIEVVCKVIVMRLHWIRFEWETFDSLGNILFPFDVWIYFPLWKCALISNLSEFQCQRCHCGTGFELNLGFMGWRYFLIRWVKYSHAEETTEKKEEASTTS